MRKFIIILIFIFCEISFGEEINDSAQLAQIKDSLYNLLQKQELYSKERHFDNEALFSPYLVKRQNITGNDYFNWEDALMGNPNFAAVRYSPSFAINRALFRGYLIPIDNDFLDRLYLPTLPFYYRDLIEVKEFEIMPDGAINENLFGEKTITPDVFFVWQGGLFDGNLLKFRMLRNLSKKLSLKAFISYSDLKRMNYFHGGGMAPLYTTYHNDSSKVSIYGYNPYSLINKSGIELNWKSNFSLNLHYSYSDIRQDLAYHTDSLPGNDTLRLSIAYNESKSYLNQVDATLEFPFGEKFLWRNFGKLETVSQNEIPISRTRNGSFATKGASRNNTLQSAGTQFYFAPATNDSISIQVSANRYILDTFNVIHTVTHHTKVFAENKFTLPNFDNFSVKIDGGFEFIRANQSKIESHPFGSAQADLKINDFRTQFWGKYNIVPFVKLIDENNRIAGNYFGFGTNFHYQFQIASIHAGYSNVLLPDEAYNFWHNNIIPYYNPQQVFSAGGSLGEIGKISLFSNWLFSDEMPYFKSYSGLRFHFNKDLQVRHFYIDISYNYWSENKTATTLGNYPYWYRPIYDVSIKLAAEIETFRLFWKIDNFLNRTNSYIPGYIMPGLIFRWGFSWNILG